MTIEQRIRKIINEFRQTDLNVVDMEKCVNEIMEVIKNKD